MAIGSKVSGDFKSASGLFAKVDGGWKKAKFGYVKVNGQWKQFWADKVEDLFNRIDTTSGLGTADSGQGWTILRSQWQINTNAAKTTGAKTDYPLASVDAGFLDFDIEANELTPGTGVAIRVLDANNWWGVVPFYNQTAQTYTYCVRSEPRTVCVQQTANPIDYTLRCDYPNTLITFDVYDTICPSGYVIGETLEVVGQECTPDRLVGGECYTEFRQNCTWKYVGSRLTQVCNPGPTTICDPPTIVPGGCTDIYDWVPYEYCPGGEVLAVVGQGQECFPDGFTNVPVYGCEQSVTYQECVQSATGTTYTNYYYLQVVKMVNGVFSVVDSIQVPDRWSAVKMSANLANLTIKVYTDSLYANQIGTYTTTAFTANGTGYGVIARDSNFEDGRTIGSLLVKPLGQ